MKRRAAVSCLLMLMALPASPTHPLAASGMTSDGAPDPSPTTTPLNPKVNPEVNPQTQPPLPLSALHTSLVSGELPGAHAVIIRQHQRTLVEWYFKGPDQTIGQDLGEVTFSGEVLHDIRSVSKSVVALLFGIALEDGLIKSLDVPVVSFFGDYDNLPVTTTQDVTLRHVLSMTSGWSWDEFTYPYTDPRNSEIAMELAEDPIRHVLTQSRVSEPGTEFHYSGGDVALIGAILSKVSGKPLDEYAREKLFEPLGIKRYGWSKRLDVPRAASGLRLTAPDMMKIAVLVADHGRYNGQQIVAADWIATITSRQIVIPDPRAPGDGYGYFWWLGQTGDVRWIGALGNGGQRIWIVPSLDLQVVTTMGRYDHPEQGDVPARILRSAIAAALADAASGKH